MSYNGWSNYATWRVNLEMFDGVTAQEITGQTIAYPSELAKQLKDYAEQLIHDTSSEGLVRDYAFAFLSDVDWYEIANNMIVDQDDEGVDE